MAKRVVYHVTPNKSGKWNVVRERASRPTSSHTTKKDAIDKARDLAKSKDLGQVKIHGRNGKIQEERTYGDDPKRTKG
jgi:hypothetical protein